MNEQIAEEATPKKKRKAPSKPKSDEPVQPRMTQEHRDYLLFSEPPSAEEAEATGLPHLCITCEHCRIIRNVERVWNVEAKEQRVVTSTRYLCAEQFNSQQDICVMTCEMYQQLPTER